MGIVRDLKCLAQCYVPDSDQNRHQIKQRQQQFCMDAQVGQPMALLPEDDGDDGAVKDGLVAHIGEQSRRCAEQRVS